MAKRKLTRLQAKRRKALAVRFVRDVLQDPERALEIESESLDSWARRTRRTITNPHQKGMVTIVANGPLNSDLQDAIDEAAGILAQAYDPMTTREDAMQAIADALDALEGNSGDEDEEDVGDDDNGDDDSDDEDNDDDSD